MLRFFRKQHIVSVIFVLLLGVLACEGYARARDVLEREKKIEKKEKKEEKEQEEESEKEEYLKRKNGGKKMLGGSTYEQFLTLYADLTYSIHVACRREKTCIYNFSKLYLKHGSLTFYEV